MGGWSGKHRYIAQLERTIEQYKAREKSGGLLPAGAGGAAGSGSAGPLATPRRDGDDDDDDDDGSAVRGGGAGSAETPAATPSGGAGAEDLDTSLVESQEKAGTEEGACLCRGPQRGSASLFLVPTPSMRVIKHAPLWLFLAGAFALHRVILPLPRGVCPPPLPRSLPAHRRGPLCPSHACAPRPPLPAPAFPPLWFDTQPRRPLWPTTRS